MALGAGAGNVLTRITRFSASLFLGLCMVLAVLSNSVSSNLVSERLGSQPSIINTNNIISTSDNITANTAATESTSTTETSTPSNTSTDESTDENPVQPAEGEGNK